MTSGLPTPEADTGGPIERNDAALPAESAAAGLTGSIADMESPDETEALRLDLASVIHDVGCRCREHRLGWTIRDRDAQQLAAGTLRAGFRRVSEDDDTTAEIRALSKALEASRGHARGARQQGLDRETCRFWQGVSGFLRSRIRALEAGEEPDWPDAANSVRADLGSCVRCGVRDAPDGEQLCEQCDCELEAEVAQDRAAVRALREET